MKLIYKLAKTKLKVCVVDNIGGSYLPIAKHLTKYFDVYYHSVVQNPYPNSSVINVGNGYKGITVLKDFWGYIDNIDLFIFPDIYFKSYGKHLRKLGKLVWGGCQSEDLETDRKLFKEELKSVGLEVAPTKYIVGIDNLINHLKGVKDKWIKISYFRGDGETFHHISWVQSQVYMNELKVSLGALGSKMEFMVEDPIKSIAEIGGDGFLVNGNNSNSFLYGLEVKDCGYLGTNCDFTKMPQPIQDVYNKFRPILQKYNHTGFYSSEIRVGENGLDYYTDICCRSGQPPGNVYMGMINNWDEILIGGARGELIEPKYAGKYGIELILKSMVQHSDWNPVVYDSKYEDNINLKASLVEDGTHYIIPFDQAGLGKMVEFGSVSVIGNDIQTITNQALEIAKSIDCFGLMYEENSLEKARESISKIEDSLKIKF